MGKPIYYPYSSATSISHENGGFLTAQATFSSQKVSENPPVRFSHRLPLGMFFTIDDSEGGGSGVFAQ